MYSRRGKPDCSAQESSLTRPSAGTLVKFEPSGKWRVVADVGGFEQAQNPAGGPLDSNPYGLLAEPGRRFVTDAGGNEARRDERRTRGVCAERSR